jgi:multimeric flavodoxin WrbA
VILFRGVVFMKVIGFNGSPRAGGNTDHLLWRLFEGLEKEGIETEALQIGGTLIRGCTACNGCLQNRDGRCVIEEDPLNEWIEKMCAADGIVIASPTYFADITPETKAFIDRTGYVARANGALFARKVGAAVVAVRRCGAIRAFDSINHFFLINQMIVPGSSYWNMGIGRMEGAVVHDGEGLATMDTLAANMAWLLKRTVGGDAS